MAFQILATKDQIPNGTLRVFSANDTRVAVSQVEGAFYAIEDMCTHDEGPLGEGVLCGEEVECPRHGARFNVKTGAALCMPAVVAVKVFPVKVEGDNVLVDVGE